MTPSRSIRRTSAIVFVLSAALLALLAAEIVSYSRNTLLNHPEWASGKLLLSHHETMRRVGSQLGVPVVNLFAHGARYEIDDAGIIWWDMVHLTSYGQRLAAESITAGILEHYGGSLHSEHTSTGREKGVGGSPATGPPI